MSTSFRLLLPAQLYREMLDQARAELPNECCGVLGGVREQESSGRIVRRYALLNAATSPVEYVSEPKSLFAAVRDMRRLGLELLAIYHSHPASDPVPSRTDRERNYSPEVINFIISLKTAEPIMRGWWLTETDYHEAEWQLLEET